MVWNQKHSLECHTTFTFCLHYVTLLKKKLVHDFQRTIYSATTFLESCRKVVRVKWFEKSGSRNLVREKWLTRKKIRVCRTTFLEKWFQIKWLCGHSSSDWKEENPQCSISSESLSLFTNRYSSTKVLLKMAKNLLCKQMYILCWARPLLLP